MKKINFCFINLFLILSFALLPGCADVERSNVNDPLNAGFFISASVSPASGSTINARDSIKITFQDSMDTTSLAVSGELSAGVNSWTSTTLANDTLTISPPVNGVWPIDSGQTVAIDCKSSYGAALDTLNLSYNVTYSVTASAAPGSGTLNARGTGSTIVISFSDPMNSASLNLTSDLLDNFADNIDAFTEWSTNTYTNDTLTITPPEDGAWLLGVNKTLTVDCDSFYGPAMDEELVLTYDVEYSVTGTATPASYNSLNARGSIEIRFSETMDTDSVETALSGTLIDSINEQTSWTETNYENDTLTISPPASDAWDLGTQTLTVNGNSIYGPAMTELPLSYNVYYTITATPDPPTGSTITGNESIVITFNEEMEPSSLDVFGTTLFDEIDDLEPTGRWTSGNTVLTLKPADPIWPTGAGEKTVTINCNNIYGIPMDGINPTYTVEHAVYIRITNSSPSNPGTKSQPIDTIVNGIAKAENLYFPANTAEVRVAGSGIGDVYETNWHEDTNRIQMVEGISLIGGYSNATGNEFNVQDSSLFITVIKDVSNGMTVSGNSDLNPNRAIYCDDTISTDTVIKGFTIKASSVAPQFSYNAAILTEGSPTITGCKIDNEIPTNDDEYSYGITINGASPEITYNEIDAGGKSSTGRSFGIYITNNPSSPTISNNMFIKGGLGDRTYGIYINTGVVSPVITYNTIYSGGGPSVSNGIYIRASHSIINYNVFKSEVLNTRGIFENNSTDTNPSTLHYNDFDFYGYWYEDNSIPVLVEDDNWDDTFHNISTAEGTQPILYSGWGNYSTATSQP